MVALHGRMPSGTGVRLNCTCEGRKELPTHSFMELLEGRLALRKGWFATQWSMSFAPMDSFLWRRRGGGNIYGKCALCKVGESRGEGGAWPIINQIECTSPFKHDFALCPLGKDMLMERGHGVLFFSSAQSSLA